ncbi:NAD(P)-binding protein [Daldinia decipiens]|uniref:NAD(P)-binding protein n=1 Tax=Daldinia decipiens TaxID=326647 RepID=UPI0020C36AF8|nr:NAD(P)-binding protein [Daldinia decipiens]KAI1655510.1 NAD(P)-binding protein [Daldinia decipiens]
MSLGAIWTQFFPPRNSAPLTDANLPSQAGKVFIVTGGSSGIGYETSRILYGAGGKVYVLTRSKDNAEDAITRIKAHYAQDGDTNVKTGTLHFIQMDMIDFESVKNAAQQFLALEGSDGRLDVLFNNAGTGARKNAPRTPQGHEYHFATNSIGHHLLTRLLAPIMSRTAKKSPKDTVRVVWAASVLVDVMSPRGGIRKEYLQDPFSIKNEMELYATSKTANWFLASEFSRRQSEAGAFGTGVVHMAANPGNYITGIWRHVPSLIEYLVRPILRYPVYGAYTYLWAAFSDSVTTEDAVTGRYVICDGRWHPGQREDLLLALRGEEEGGSGRAREYFEWCEERVKEFLD